MGINFNLSNYNKKKFVDIFFYFGLKKNKLNFFFNTFILGFKNEYSIIHPEVLIEQSKRIFLFCYNLILTNGFFLFLNFNRLLIKNYVHFLVFRSLEVIIHSK